MPNIVELVFFSEDEAERCQELCILFDILKLLFGNELGEKEQVEHEDDISNETEVDISVEMEES